MKPRETLTGGHPEGEHKNDIIESEVREGTALSIETDGGVYQVAWDEKAAATPLGQLVFFAQFLKTSELFKKLCKEAPFEFKSNNAPQVEDVLGTLMLSILSGQSRYAHISGLRFDRVSPPILGMKKIISEDSARRALKKLNQLGARQWQQQQLRGVWEPLLYEAWVLDVDTTIKTIYGHQQGAEIGYNPHKPGRPSHTYHTYWIARLRLCLDVEVRPGKEHSGKHSMPGLWELIDSLPRRAWPQLMRGDCSYGNEEIMSQAEQRGLCYLFKQRQTKKTKDLIRLLERQGGWNPAGQDFEATEGELQLQGWSSKRRVVVARRRKAVATQTKEIEDMQPQLALCGQYSFETVAYDYIVLVTSLPYEPATLVALYRERSDAENPFDELKNQWGWAGFTTHDFERCQIMARFIALVYNWWSLFVRLVDRQRHREAVTSRPMLLAGVARQTRHAGQTKLSVNISHAQANEIKDKLTQASGFLGELLASAGQLGQPERWRRILARIFEKYLAGRPLADPLQPLAYA